LSAIEPNGVAVPPETNIIRPLAARVTRLEDGDVLLEFEVPNKVVGIFLPAEAKRQLIQGMTGVALPDAPTLPTDLHGV
jgi:hypothetical protein